jgi:hypothetical protein
MERAIMRVSIESIYECPPLKAWLDSLDPLTLVYISIVAEEIHKTRFYEEREN